MPSKPASAPLGKSLSDTAPGYEARAGLQRDREAAAQLQNPVPRGSRPDVPLEEGDFLPAAALLRAMTVYRASQKRTELRAIYKRLSELHARRSALGHRADD